MLGDLRWRFVFHCPHRFLTLIQTTIRTLRCVVNNDKVCETQHPRVCAFGAQTDELFSWRAIQPACTINQFWEYVCVVLHNHFCVVVRNFALRSVLQGQHGN